MAFGGSSKEMEMAALEMERKGEVSFMRAGDPMPTSATGIARMAIASLQSIKEGDPEREKALRIVFDWLALRLGPGGASAPDSEEIEVVEEAETVSPSTSGSY
jgi:hypothetical protein